MSVGAGGQTHARARLWRHVAPRNRNPWGVAAHAIRAEEPGCALRRREHAPWGTGVLVGVAVGVMLGLLVGVTVGVSVGVLLGVLVGVAIGVSVGVNVGGQTG